MYLNIFEITKNTVINVIKAVLYDFSPINVVSYKAPDCKQSAYISIAGSGPTKTGTSNF